MKMNWPNTPAAVRMPAANERRRTNQRLVTTAAKVIVRQPVPSPMMSPQQSTSCHTAFMTVVAAAPTAMRDSAAAATRRTPNRSISAAENGAINPLIAMFTHTASPIDPCDQANSSCSGSTSRPGMVLKAPAAMMVTAAMATIHQARCTGESRCAGGRSEV